MDLKEIIKNEQVEIMFQPIMSTHHIDFLGFESLVRGINENGGLIPPNLLFNEAKRLDLVLELDKVCIKKGLETAGPIYEKHPDMVLFLNVDASVIDYYINSTYIVDLVDHYRLSPSNIVLEVNELPVESLDVMKDFAKIYREAGFLIAIDDIGAGSSNLDRIPLIMPDIMKIDKELIHDIDKSFYKTQVVSMIIQLATNLGALIVVEGVEEINELSVISEFGAYMIQGYYLGKPGPLTETTLEDIKIRVNRIVKSLHMEAVKKAETMCKQQKYMNRLCDSLLSSLNKVTTEKYETIIPKVLKGLDISQTVESVYVINEAGLLITPTIFNSSGHKVLGNGLYKPCGKGQSVQLENYYTKLIYEKHLFWFSKEYISKATGNKCITLSKPFKSRLGNGYIICIDFSKNNLSRRIREEQYDRMYMTKNA